jgi:hypothetical protein
LRGRASRPAYRGSFQGRAFIRILGYHTFPLALPGFTDSFAMFSFFMLFTTGRETQFLCERPAEIITFITFYILNGMPNS